MIDISPQLLHELHVISEKDPAELRSIYEEATRTLDLRSIDYCTIRDLVRLSGKSDAALHLVLIALFVSLNEGSVCLKLGPESLKKKLEPLSGVDTGKLAKIFLSKIDSFAELIYTRDAASPPLFNDPRSEYKPLVLLQEGDEYFLYFQKYYDAEQKLKQCLDALMQRRVSLSDDPERVRAAMHSVLHEKPLYIQGVKAVLNDGQTKGIMLPLLKNFVLVSGGPGTGKTFIVFTLLRVLARLGVPVERIKIAAPTGRAARKLTEAIQSGIASIPDRDAPFDAIADLQGTTIHKLLGFSPSRNDFSYNANNKIQADIIIIDEASMIDLVLLGRLFEAVADRTAILMLGDRNQLPSVEAGAVLAHLIPDKKRPSDTMADRIVLLDESYRSGQFIRTIAKGINDQDPGIIEAIPELKANLEFPAEGIWRIDLSAARGQVYKHLRRVLNSWVTHFYSGKDGPMRSHVAQAFAHNLNEMDEGFSACGRAIFSCLDEARILTPLRSGGFGTAGINSYIAGAVGGAFDPAGSGKIFSGAPIIIEKNDYDRELFNGDVGVILRGNNGRYYGVFRSADGFRTFPVEALPPFELAYAITVHKSQGSEFGCVLFIVPEGMNAHLLTKEIIYTGITRAKRLAVIYSGKAILAQAIRNKMDRQSGFIMQ
jgi:exodeoxyribonuclease V alpha subunit